LEESLREIKAIKAYREDTREERGGEREENDTR
jgi:hypothetical protein